MKAFIFAVNSNNFLFGSYLHFLASVKFVFIFGLKSKCMCGGRCDKDPVFVVLRSAFIVRFFFYISYLTFKLIKPKKRNYVSREGKYDLNCCHFYVILRRKCQNLTNLADHVNFTSFVYNNLTLGYDIKLYR